MPKMNKWRWWAGSAEVVDDDAIYDVDYPSRDAAIEGGNGMVDAGDEFCIVEACLLDRVSERGGREYQPFAAQRNHERFRAGSPPQSIGK